MVIFQPCTVSALADSGTAAGALAIESLTVFCYTIKEIVLMQSQKLPKNWTAPDNQPPSQGCSIKWRS